LSEVQFTPIYRMLCFDNIMSQSIQCAKSDDS